MYNIKEMQLTLDALLESRELMFKKFNSLGVELGILELDKTGVHVLKDPPDPPLDTINVETQDKLLELKALESSLGLTWQDYKACEAKLSQSRKEI